MDTVATEDDEIVGVGDFGNIARHANGMAKWFYETELVEWPSNPVLAHPFLCCRDSDTRVSGP